MALKNTKFNPTSHTHSKSQITDFPASLKNPNSISIQLNGGTATTYDGSAAKSINITPGSIGAATSGHTHSQYYDSNQSHPANTVLAAPNGSDGTASFRKLVASDIPSLNYLSLKGTNTYQGSDDNTGNWGTQGFSLHWYNANFLKHQPAMYIYVMNLTMGGSEVHQIACAQTGGSLYHRGGNSYGWSPADGSWATILDNRNYTSFCLPLSGGTITGSLRVNNNITTNTIELYAAKPFIDFHFDGNSGDYTSRIIENASGILNINGATFTTGGTIWGTGIAIDGIGSFSSGITCGNQSRFWIAANGYSDPHPNNNVPIKVGGEIAAGRFYKRGVSTTWISGAQPSGGCGFEVVYDPSRSDATENAFVPGYRLRNYSGAWVFASYNQNRTAHIYYCDAARLTNGNNGTDADFVFNVNGNFAAKSVTQTSDETKKDIIYDNIPDSYKELFMNIKPFIFKWNDIKEDALHIGFGAQTTLQTAINAGIKEEEIGFIVKGGEDAQGVYTPWSANYTEFVPLTIAICQEQDKEIKALKAKNDEYEQRISKLEEMLMATMA